MKRIIFFLACICVLQISAKAQLANGSIAPDFTVTDLDGNEHHLYSLLDEGKTVIIDLYAVWCGPCWNYHQTHALQNAWEKYGPDGTNDLFVMGIEADPNTAIPCIIGDCSNTIGNWREGVTFPMIDDASVGDAYALAYYPTIYLIYPNRVITEIRQAPLTQIDEYIAQVPTLNPGIHAEVINFSGVNGSTCFSSLLVNNRYTLSNMGEETITELNYSILKNGEIIKEGSWTGEAQPYQIITKVNAAPEIATENATYTLRISINGIESIADAYKSSVTFKTENTIYMHIETDEKSAEDDNVIQIVDQDDEVLFEYEVNEQNKTYDLAFDLESQGCYSVKFYDNGFNGMQGVVRVKDAYDNLILENRGFTSVLENDFYVDAVTSVQEIENSSFVVSPNPVADILQVNTERGIPFQYYKIIDISGKVLMQSDFTQNVNVSQLEQGTYLLVLECDGKSYIGRFVKY